MTKKDYILISTALYRVQPNNAYGELTKQAIIDNLIFVLARDNPSFDGTLFTQACVSNMGRLQ